MSRPEDNIDQLIRAALTNEESEVFDSLGEQTIFEEAFGILKGRGRFITGSTMIISVLLFVAAVYSGFQFFEAETTKELIAWAVGFCMGMMAVGTLKIWWWMEMEKNATIREIKRVELQIAVLARTLESK